MRTCWCSTNPPTISTCGPAQSLEKAIRKFDGTVLLVSHDRYFLNQVADHLIVMQPGSVQVLAGNYDTYLHHVA